MPGTVTQLIEEARRQAEEVDPASFAKASEDSRAVVVDLRESDERIAHGSIRGAIHIPRGMLEFRADPASPYHDDRLRPDHRILLHCASGARSALAAMTLHQLGYHNVAHLRGGIQAWRDSGLPIVEPPPAPY